MPQPTDEQILAHVAASGSIEGTALALDVHPTVVRQLYAQRLMRRVERMGSRGADLTERFRSGLRQGRS